VNRLLNVPIHPWTFLWTCPTISEPSSERTQLPVNLLVNVPNYQWTLLWTYTATSKPSCERTQLSVNLFLNVPIHQWTFSWTYPTISNTYHTAERADTITRVLTLTHWMCALNTIAAYGQQRRLSNAAPLALEYVQILIYMCVRCVYKPVCLCLFV